VANKHIYRVVGVDGSFWGWMTTRREAVRHATEVNADPEWFHAKRCCPLRVQRTKVNWKDAK